MLVPTYLNRKICCLYHSWGLYIQNLSDGINHLKSISNSLKVIYGKLKHIRSYHTYVQTPSYTPPHGHPYTHMDTPTHTWVTHTTISCTGKHTQTHTHTHTDTHFTPILPSTHTQIHTTQHTDTHFTPILPPIHTHMDTYHPHTNTLPPIHTQINTTHTQIHFQLYTHKYIPPAHRYTFHSHTHREANSAPVYGSVFAQVRLHGLALKQPIGSE